MKVRVGFDLGGTNMGAGLIDYEGNILFQDDCPTLAMESFENVVGRMKNLLRNCFNEAEKKGHEISSIGMGCPGLLDSDKGIVRFSPNLPQWKDVEIGKIISDEFKVPVAIDNDVRVAALGEYNFGAGKGFKNIICITVGTGIGGGLILDGKLLRGPTQSIGEIGHMTLKKDGPLCGCGNYGCLEALASSTAIIRSIKEVFEKNTSPLMKELHNSGIDLGAYLVSQAINRGDKEAARIMSETGEWIGIGLANVVNLLNPDIIIIGGGVALAGDILFEPIKKEISQRALKIPADFVKVVPALLGDSAGMIGASTLIG